MNAYNHFYMWIDNLVLNDIEVFHAENPSIISLSEQTPIKVSNSNLRGIYGLAALETRDLSSPITVTDSNIDFVLYNNDSYGRGIKTNADQQCNSQAFKSITITLWH